MLPAQNRLRRSADFSAVVRSGARAKRGSLVLHIHRPSASSTTSAGPVDPKVGLIVGKTVGNSVIRHQVSRRLRAQLADRITQLPLGSHAVVRALPTAASATSVQLGADLDSALARVLRSSVSASAVTRSEAERSPVVQAQTLQSEVSQ